MFSLKPRQELRIETVQDITLKVLDGSIEIFGREVANNVDLCLKKGLKLGLFSWQGAQLEISGTLGSDYIADETPMVSYLNVFLALEQMREYTLPRVMVVGGADVGKSSLSKILTNYLTKQGKELMFVDTDPNKMSLSLCGSIGATCVKQALDIEQGWGAAQSLLGNIPIVFYYGYSKIFEFKEYYEKLLSAISTVVNQKIDKSSDLRALLINTPPEFTNSTSGFDLLLKAMELFSVNVVLVIGHERLYSNLLKKAVSLIIKY
jgi:polyribonucleotide 5'-hydroxyl-kinase